MNMILFLHSILLSEFELNWRIIEKLKLSIVEWESAMNWNPEPVFSDQFNFPFLCSCKNK